MPKSTKCIICGQKAKYIIDRERYCDAHQHVAGDQAILDALGQGLPPSSARTPLVTLKRRLSRRGWAIDHKELLATLNRMRDEGFLVRTSNGGRVKSMSCWRAA